MKLSAFIAAMFLVLAATIYIPPVSADAASFVLNQTEITQTLDSGGAVYARIFSENAYIYSDAECQNGIFILPVSYYVKVTEYSPDACRAVYCFEDYDYARAIFGYVKTEKLTFVSEPPSGRSFPNVFAEFEGRGTFYKNTRFDSFYPSSETANEENAYFYGFYMRGRDKYCYVLSGGKFGYYSADVFKDISVAAHTDPKPVYRPNSSSSSSSSARESENFFSSDTNKIIFIAVSCIIAVSCVYLVFLPKRKKEPLPGEDEEE